VCRASTPGTPLCDWSRRPLLPGSDTLDVGKKVLKHRVRRLDLGPVADFVVEHHDVGIRDDLEVALRHVPARVWVGRPVDQPHGDVGLPHRADPPIAMRVAVVDEPADLVYHPLAVVVLEDLVKQVEHPSRRFGLRPEQLVEGGLHQAPGQWGGLKGTQHVPQRCSRQRLLQQSRGVCLVEQAAVEPGDRLDAQRSIDLLTVLMARQHLLADRVTEVMGENVRGSEAEVRQQCLVHVGVVMHRVLVFCGLVGEPHSEHVGCDHREAIGQPLP
jgi:hypothetical protein